MALKKLILSISFTLLMAFVYFALEFLLYSVLINNNILYYFFFVIVFVIIGVQIECYNKLGWYGKFTNWIFALASVFLGLGALKIFISLL